MSGVRDSWVLRNTAAETLLRVEEQVRRQLEAASAEELVALLESFSPARSPGPEWTRSFDALVEHLWAWCAPDVLSTVEADFRGRGAAWAAVANALTAEYGAHVREQLQRHTASARLPTFTLA